MLKYLLLREIVQRVADVLRGENLSERNKLKVRPSCDIYHDLLISGDCVIALLLLLGRGVKHGSAVHVFYCGGIVSIIIVVQLASYHLFIQLQVGEWLNLTNTLQLVGLIVVPIDIGSPIYHFGSVNASWIAIQMHSGDC